MERSIIFRAKRMDSNEWLFGSLFVDKKEQCYIKEPNGKLYFIEDKDTIGQFTGLQDKNGREIYEGDIVRKTETTYRMTDLGVVRYCNEEAKFVLHVTDKYGEYNFSFVKDFQSQDGHATVSCHNEYEVIGNIYDNPDLLKQ